MKYLSMDLEATGLKQNCLIIELAFIPFCTQSLTLNEELKKHYYVKCPSFEDLKDGLDPWVIEHNEKLIRHAHNNGSPINEVKMDLENYLSSKAIKDYFADQKIILFGKSMNAIDLPFLNRDFGYEWMRKFFSHRTNDLTSNVYQLIDLNLLPSKTESGSELMKYLGMGQVAHTALEDARNTAIMYFELIKKFKK